MLFVSVFIWSWQKLWNVKIQMPFDACELSTADKSTAHMQIVTWTDETFFHVSWQTKKCNGDKATSAHHLSTDNVKRIFFKLMSTGRRYFGQQRHKNIWQRHCEDFFRGQKKKQQHRIEIYLMPQWKKQWTSRFFWYVNEKIMDDAKKSTSNTGSWFSVNGKLDASNALKKLRWRCLFRFLHCCMSMHSWNYG